MFVYNAPPPNINLSALKPLKAKVSNPIDAELDAEYELEIVANDVLEDHAFLDNFDDLLQVSYGVAESETGLIDC